MVIGSMLVFKNFVLGEKKIITLASMYRMDGEKGNKSGREKPVRKP